VVGLKKVSVVLVILFSITLFGVSFSVDLFPLISDQPLQLQNRAGSRTVNVGYSVISTEDSSRVFILVRGWFFRPDDVSESMQMDLEISSDLENYTRRLSLSRDGFYYVLDPFIVAFPSGYRLRIMGIEIPYAVEWEVEVKELDFIYLEVSSEDRKESGADFGRISDGAFESTRFVGDLPVIVIKGGERPTGGFSIKVESVTLRNDIIEVISRLHKPGRDDFVTQAFTYPQIAIGLKDLKPGDYTVVVRIETVTDGVVEDVLTVSDWFQSE
jgi:hypothetical protein